MVKMNWDYIAGFFDGEGNVSIKYKEGRRPQPCVNISQRIDRIEVLNIIKAFLREHDIVAYVYTDKKKKAYIQIAESRSVKLFLETVKEKVIVKKNDAEKALKCQTFDKKWTNLSAKEIEEIIRLRKEGFSPRKIAQKLGRDHSNIYKMFKKLHLPTNLAYSEKASGCS